jgi:hypothetical protein
MSAILLGIIIAGAIIILPIAAFLIIHNASREDTSSAPAPPPPSGWDYSRTTPPFQATNIDQQQRSAWPGSTSAPIAPSQPMVESSSPSMLVGKIIRNLAGPNLEAITILSRLSAQIETENQGRNLTRAERQQKVVAALDDLATREPGNETLQKLRDSIHRAADDSGTTPAAVTITEPPIVTFANGSGTPAQSTVLGKLFEHLGSEMDAAGVLGQYAAQVQAGGDGNLEDKLQTALRALNEAAARNPNNAAIQKMRESLQRAANDQNQTR